jgi:SprB repeat/Secretion system C-terminal sorting domain/PKD domain
MKTKLFWGLVWSVLCLLSQTTHAQNPYLGGAGDGYAKADFAEVSINIFSGGNADGYDRNKVVMLGDTAAFRGGVEDGYAKIQTAMLGDSAAFRGGVEDGYAKTKAAMLGDSTAFRGGVEDGYAKAQGGQTSALTLTASPTNALCVGGTGSLTANATLGATPYLYKINNGTNQTSPTFLNLATGAYTVMVTDALGYTATTVANISAPTISVSLTTTATQPCPGANNGSITIVAANGTAPYTYNIGGANQTSPTFNNTPAATYTIRVTDANGCSTTQLVALTALPTTTLTLTNTVSPTCNGDSNGSFSLAANGGLAPYSYNIGGADQSNPTFNNLTAGTYTARVTDANGCSTTRTVNIISFAALSINITNNTPPNCNGNASGSFSLSANGGVAPYSYNIGGANQNNSAFTGLTAGTYTANVTDANGCSTTRTVVVADVPAVNIAVVSNISPSCNSGANGSFSLSANGGVLPYSYSIGGANQTNPTFTSLTAGTYTARVTDANSCSTTQIVTITNLPAVVLSVTNTVSPTCNFGTNGSISLLANGGVAPYTYNIGGTNQVSNLFNGLTAGTYIARVTDANGCFNTQTVVITAPPALAFSATAIVNPTCNGNANGSINVAASGGTAPYRFSINGGSSQTAGLFTGLAAGVYTLNVADANSCTQNITYNLSQPAALVSIYSANIPCGGDSLTFTLPISGGTLPYTGGGVRRLPAGTYNFPISDANGCTTTATVVLTTAPRLFVQANVTPLTCLTQTTNVALSPIGGTPPYQGVTNISSGAGTFTFTISDNAGCVADTTLTIVRAGANPTANFSYTINNGTVSFINTSADITQNTWSFGDASAGSTTTNPAHTYTTNGVYTVTLTTQNYCGTSSTTQQVTILITSTEALNAQQGEFARLFPNPTNGIVNVQARLAKAEPLTITLCDALGRTLLVQNLAKNDSFEQKIDVTNFASGVYWIILATETKRQVIKVVKE